MALFVLCEPEYMQTTWYAAKVKGIMDKAASHRIRHLHFLSDLHAASELALTLDEDSSVILLFDSLFWLQKAAEALSECHAQIILSADHIGTTLPIRYSQVGADVDTAVYTAINYLHSCGKHRIALLGTIADSCADRARASMLEKYLPPEECHVFYAEDPSAGGMGAITTALQDFDAVLCTNNLLAIHLGEHLPKEAKPFILSLMDAETLRLYRGGISALSAQHYNCGRELIETHHHRSRYGFANRITLLPTTLTVRGSTENIPYVPTKKGTPCVQTAYSPLPAGDRLPVETINRLEFLLTSGDLIQLKVIYCILCGFTRSEIKDFCFVTSETARYRVNKVRNAFGVKDIAHVTNILRTYITKEHLLSLIREREAQGRRF